MVINGENALWAAGEFLLAIARGATGKVGDKAERTHRIQFLNTFLCLSQLETMLIFLQRAAKCNCILCAQQ